MMKLAKMNHSFVIAIVSMGYFFSACDDAVIHFDRGLDYHLQGKLEDASAEFQRAIAIDPNFIMAHFHLGWVYQDQGKLEDAKVEFQRVIAMPPYPDFAEAHYHLACVYSLKNEKEQAIEWLQKAIVLDETVVYRKIYAPGVETGVSFDNIRESLEFQQLIGEIVLIPAGSFQMGDSKNEPESWMKPSRPVHGVELDGFYMDKYEVTVGQFKQFVEQSGYSYEGDWNDVAKYSPSDQHPMIYVTWNDATAYAKWAGKRLPTEAEWEYAARGGLKGKRYPWGDSIGNVAIDGHKANYDYDENVGRTTVVGIYGANGYGLYDMAGNVWEWCADWYGSDYYSKSPGKNPLGPDTGKYRVFRGGSWNGLANTMRVDFRGLNAPVPRTFDGGFRCVSDLP